MSLINRGQLQHALREYSSSFKEELAFREDFLDLLEANTCYQRDHLPGHITGSAWIVDETISHVVMLHHGKLNKWLQPGGHADGDENIFRVALREAEEETGITTVNLVQHGIFDLDIHPIPEHKNFPEHLHFDVRFIFTASGKQPLTCSDESHELKWVPLKEVELLTDHSTSISRMVQKTLLLARSNQR
ncbi:MAG: NUDIX hydrolase [Cyclobacteriaceae bacterium]|nr:NUDIX hydrolase [Cyclobacteriaceae bacterium]